jgi:PKD repeat protein
MRRLAPVLVVVFLAWAAPANAKPTVNVQASTTLGAAPLTVTLTASGDAVAYHWDLGDRSTAEDRSSSISTSSVASRRR